MVHIGAASRHALFFIKPSIPEDVLAAHIYDVFKIIEAGGVVKQCGVKWTDVNPFTDQSQKGIEGRAEVQVSLGEALDIRNVRHIITMMGWAMTGILTVRVAALAEENVCCQCGRGRPVTPRYLEACRRFLYGVVVTCVDCMGDAVGSN